MKLVRKYVDIEQPAEIEISMSDTKLCTDVISVVIDVRDVEDGDGALSITQAVNPAPIPAEYDAIVEAILALRYTIGAEIALNRLPDNNEEKQEYLAFVEAAKAAAKSALRLNGYAAEEVEA